MARIQLTAAAALLVLAVVLGVVLVFGADGKVTAGPGDRTVGPTGFYGAVAPEGIRARVALHDQDGRRVALAGLRGKVVVLAFMYSTCQDTCPTTAQQIRLALDDLGDVAHRVPALAVSVDPPPAGGDTPLNAKQFLARQSLTGRMRFLLGSRAELQGVWKAFGIQPQGQGKRAAGVDPQAFEHSAKVVVVDPRGRVRLGYPVSELTPEDLAHDIRRLAGGA